MTAWPPPALVLTAGLGTRLRPLSDYRAKPAMPVGRDALACHILRRLADAGIREAVLNLHHLPHTITREVGDGSQCGLRVRYSWEQPRVLGSAGGPRHAMPLVDADTLLIVNGDTLCDLPIRALWDAHVASGALVTLGLMPHPQPGRYGGVVIDAPDAAPDTRYRGPDSRLPTPDSRLLSAGAVTAFVPRTSAVPSVHFPGIQIVHRSVLAALPDGVLSESVLEVYPLLMKTEPGAVRGAVFDAHFDDVGTVEDYRRTCRALAGDADGNVIDPLATVAADARLRGCIVWPGARVPSGAVLDDVVVTGHAPLAAGTRLENVVA
ncbi:Glucose-1-phosphate adenylyltransferase [Luteitalea pratensis]|uniref:Glucose-1-phosphate adenylyltransferase n=1 Tax=Luteitalea pratensis TaxID=1855912 RepID=A0A143PS35_LUTPR|nr:NDP-sugar synthase [Luteitalea pratensis]AMY11547.1 Glucose-1-phosphate adenylyltransferase [Luteitalea pratensis]